MAENADSDIYAMSDKAILGLMGSFVKTIRLRQNKTQEQVALDAGMVRSTLVQMENGDGGKLITFIQLARTLGQLHVFRHFQLQDQISPLALAKLEQGKRQRARNKNDNRDQGTKTDW